MKGLLIKDIRLLLGQKQFFFIVVGFGIMLMFTNSPSGGVAYIVGLLTYFTLSTISYDEFDNGMPYIMTLPIKRKDYVREKYLFAMLLCAIGCVFSSIIGIIFSYIREYQNGVIEVLVTACIMIGVSMLMMAVLIPMQVKFGAEKGRIAILAGFAGVGIVIALLAKFVDLLGIDIRFVQLNAAIMVLMAVFALILALLVSYLICTRIILKKEY